MSDRKQNKKQKRKHSRGRRSRLGLVRKLIPLMCIAVSMLLGCVAMAGAVVLADKVFG